MSNTRSNKSKNTKNLNTQVSQVPIKKRQFPEKRLDIKPPPLSINSNLLKEIKYIRSLEKHILILQNSLKHDYDKYEIGISKIEDQKDLLNKRYQDKIAENKQLKTEAVKKQKIINSLLKEKNHLAEKHSKISAKIQDQGKIITKKTADLDELNTTLEGMIGQNMDLSNSLTNKETELTVLEKNNNQLKSDIKAKEEYVKTIENMFDYRASIIEELTNKNKEYKNANEKLQFENQELKQQIQLLNTQNSKLPLPKVSKIIDLSEPNIISKLSFINNFTNSRFVVAKSTPPTEVNNYSNYSNNKKKTT
jgi:chromosome segregation ATPase